MENKTNDYIETKRQFYEAQGVDAKKAYRAALESWAISTLIRTGKMEDAIANGVNVEASDLRITIGDEEVKGL